MLFSKLIDKPMILSSLHGLQEVVSRLRQIQVLSLSENLVW